MTVKRIKIGQVTINDETSDITVPLWIGIGSGWISINFNLSDDLQNFVTIAKKLRWIYIMTEDYKFNFITRHILDHRYYKFVSYCNDLDCILKRVEILDNYKWKSKNGNISFKIDIEPSDLKNKIRMRVL